MPAQNALSLGQLELKLPKGKGPQGNQVFSALVALAQDAVQRLRKTSKHPVAAISRLRGTGRGCSLSALLDTLDRDHPLELVAPFEGSDKVSGAVWRGDQLIGPKAVAAIAKLVWHAGANDLPMHVHEQSDRFIIVRKGRGYFHVTDESIDDFTGTRVRSIPARERDVFLFSRGVVHTFSTEQEAMTLFSCQLPFVAFDRPDQYRLPKRTWTAGTCADGYPATVACDPAWSVLAEQVPPIPAYGTGICGS